MQTFSLTQTANILKSKVSSLVRYTVKLTCIADISVSTEIAMIALVCCVSAMMVESGLSFFHHSVKHIQLHPR